MLVRVEMPIYVGGIRKEVGDLVDLPYVDAMGAIHRGRASRAPEEKPSVAGPMISQPVAEPVAPQAEPVLGKKRKFAQKE